MVSLQQTKKLISDSLPLSKLRGHEVSPRGRVSHYRLLIFHAGFDIRLFIQVKTRGRHSSALIIESISNPLLKYYRSTSQQIARRKRPRDNMKNQVFGWILREQ